MDDLKRLLIERACERLILDYAYAVDHGEGVRIADMFVEDGVFDGVAVKLAGRDEFIRFYTERKQRAGRVTRHINTNILIEVIDERNATGFCYTTAYIAEGDPERRVSPAAAPSVVAEYRDEFVRTDAGWRFKRRELRATFGSTA